MRMLGVGLVMALGVVGLSSGQVMADVTCPAGSARAGSSAASMSQCGVPDDGGDSEDNFLNLMGSIINFLIGIAAVISIFVIVIAGIQMATSQGDSAKVAKARNMILYGIVGLVVAILAFSIVNFVLVRVF